MSVFVGIDIAKAKFDVALLRAGKYKTKVFANNAQGHQAFVDWLQANQGLEALLCMEATGGYFEALACVLADRGLQVAVVNPAAVAAFAQSELARSKTDRGDARLLARFAMSQQPGRWVAPLPHVRELRDLVRRLEDLQQLEGQELNRMELASASTEASIQAVLDTVQAQIAEVKRRIRKHLDDHPDLRGKARLLASIPGIGETTAALLLAELRFEAFPCARAIATFAGLSVALRCSGSSLRARPRLAKTGAVRLRKALYFPAISACRHNPLVRQFYQRLLANGKTKMQALCAAMRKLLHIAYGVIKSGKPFDPTLADHLPSSQPC